MRPTPEQIAESRAHFERLIRLGCLTDDDIEHVRVLIAAVEPPTDEEIYATAAVLWKDAAAENEPDFTEGVHACIRHFLGPVKP